jgi:hypothetical protein
MARPSLAAVRRPHQLPDAIRFLHAIESILYRNSTSQLHRTLLQQHRAKGNLPKALAFHIRQPSQSLFGRTGLHAADVAITGLTARPLTSEQAFVHTHRSAMPPFPLSRGERTCSPVPAANTYRRNGSSQLRRTNTVSGQWSSRLCCRASVGNLASSAACAGYSSPYRIHGALPARPGPPFLWALARFSRAQKFCACGS